MGVFWGEMVGLQLARANGRSFGNLKYADARLTGFGNLSYCCCRPIDASQFSSCSLLASPRWIGASLMDMTNKPWKIGTFRMVISYPTHGQNLSTGKSYLPMDSLNSMETSTIQLPMLSTLYLPSPSSPRLLLYCLCAKDPQQTS